MSPTVEGIRLGTVGKEINLRRILSEVRQLGKELNLLKERFCDGEFGRRFSHHLATRRLASYGSLGYQLANSILTESNYVFFRV